MLDAFRVGALRHGDSRANQPGVSPVAAAPTYPVRSLPLLMVTEKLPDVPPPGPIVTVAGDGSPTSPYFASVS